MRRLAIDQNFAQMFSGISILNTNGHKVFYNSNTPGIEDELLYIAPGALYSKDRISYLNLATVYLPYKQLSCHFQNVPLIESLKFPLRVEQFVISTTTSSILNYIGKGFRRPWNGSLEKIKLPKSDTIYVTGPLAVMTEDYVPLFMGFVKRSFIDSLEPKLSNSIGRYSSDYASYKIDLLIHKKAKLEFLINPLLFSDPQYATFRKFYEKYLFPVCIEAKVNVTITSDFPEILPKIVRSNLTLEQSAEYAKLYASRKYFTDLSQVRRYTIENENRQGIEIEESL